MVFYVTVWTDISFPQQQSQQIQAESMLGKIMDKLEYVGVMAMECFVVGINY